jgi:hypothetical protein
MKVLLSGDLTAEAGNPSLLDDMMTIITLGIGFLLIVIFMVILLKVPKYKAYIR